MPPRPLHDVDITPDLVRGLLRRQHPDLADRPVIVAASGWDNVTVRLGEDLAARLPRRRAAAALILHEQRWLPDLAPRLPVPVPVPVRLGRPDTGYPYAWSLVPWRDGVPAVADDGTPATLDVDCIARSVAEFLASLHIPAPPGAPANPVRGVPLAARSALDDRNAALVSDHHDVTHLVMALDEGRSAPPWREAPRWLHGDLHPGNLLLAEGRLASVLDFGDLTAGDPATDLAIAWMLLPAHARRVLWDDYSERSGYVEAALWARARGWAASLALAFLAHSEDDPRIEAIGARTADALRDG